MLSVIFELKKIFRNKRKTGKQITERPELKTTKNFSFSIFLLGFIPCKAEQTLWGIELQEKEAKKIPAV